MPIEAKSHTESPSDKGTKVCSNGPGQMTKMVKKKKKNLLLRNPKGDDLETWYVALSAQVLPSLFK